MNWHPDTRLICAALLAAGGILFMLRLPARRARIAWIVLWAAALLNALSINVQESNLLGTNLIHYYLGAKYALPYDDFYRAFQAALGRPQVDLRDLSHPETLLNAERHARRAYYIGLLREAGVAFDPMAPVDTLALRAAASGAVDREARRILAEVVPAGRIESFRRDVERAEAVPKLRPVVDDYGYNGSPFYSMVRRLDPSLHAPFGMPAGWIDLLFQIVSVALMTWLAGRALGLEPHEWIAAAAMLQASWDFVGYAMSGLVFGELWLPVMLALVALRRGRGAWAGVAAAWAGLTKLFPFVLLLVPIAWLSSRWRRAASSGGAWAWRMIAACAGATVAFGLLATLVGQSWSDFLGKIMVQFGADFSAANSVSRDAFLQVLGVPRTPLSPVLTAAALALVAGLFLDRDDAPPALPRRALVMLAALGWMVHNWANYYFVAPWLLLPFYARRHRTGATMAALAMAASCALPEFGQPVLFERPILHGLKLLPYLAVPAWFVVSELRAIGFGVGTRRVAAAVGLGLLLLVSGEVWRMHALRELAHSAVAMERVHDSAGAIEAYRAMVRLSPGDGGTWMNLAIALADAGRMPEATDAFARAAARSPESAAAQDNYGRVLLLEGHLDAASRQLERALALAPHDPDVLCVLARIRMAQSRRDDAVRLVEHALEVEPGNPAIVSLLEQIRRH